MYLVSFDGVYFTSSIALKISGFVRFVLFGLPSSGKWTLYSYKGFLISNLTRCLNYIALLHANENT